jgi:hypothetical protein
LEKWADTLAMRSGERRPPTDEEIRFGNALRELCRNAPLVVAAEMNQWVISNGAYQSREASTLVFAVLSCVKDHLDRGTPLAMPREVVEVYSRFPEARPSHECEDCGYALPFGHPQPLSNPPQPVKIHFEYCPLCGGKVSRLAFRMKRQRELQATA